jgi:hypothetical protein
MEELPSQDVKRSIDLGAPAMSMGDHFAQYTGSKEFQSIEIGEASDRDEVEPPMTL